MGLDKSAWYFIVEHTFHFHFQNSLYFDLTVIAVLIRPRTNDWHCHAQSAVERMWGTTKIRRLSLY